MDLEKDICVDCFMKREMNTNFEHNQQQLTFR